MLQFFGQFHPAVVHFPVALLLMAMLSEAAAWGTRRPVLQQFGAWNLHLGATSAIVAAVLGWALGTVTNAELALSQTLFWHRWLGTGTAVCSAIAVVAWHRNRKAPHAFSIAIYRFALLAGGALVAVSGHLGGMLVYGLDYYQWALK